MIIFETHVQITKNAKLTDASILITVYLMQTVTTKRKQKFKRNKSFNPSVDRKTITAIQENGGWGQDNIIAYLETKQKWFHLRDKPFPLLAKRGMIDVLLAADNRKFMTTTKEVPGKAECKAWPTGMDSNWTDW